MALPEQLQNSRLRRYKNEDQENGKERVQPVSGAFLFLEILILSLREIRPPLTNHIPVFPG